MYTPNGSSLNVWKIAFQDSDTDGCCSQVMTTMPAAHNPPHSGSQHLVKHSIHSAATMRRDAMQSVPSAEA